MSHFLLSVITLLILVASVCHLKHMNVSCHKDGMLFLEAILLGGEVRWLGGEASPLSPPVDETLPVQLLFLSLQVEYGKFHKLVFIASRKQEATTSNCINILVFTKWSNFPIAYCESSVMVTI